MKKYQFIFKMAVVALASSSFMLNAKISVVVNHQAQVSALSKTDLADIFLEKIGSYSSNEKLTPVDQRPNAVRAFFYERVLGKSNAEMKAYWSREIFTGHSYPPREVEGDEGVIAAVASNPSYVGYVNSTAADSRVKVVASVD